MMILQFYKEYNYEIRLVLIKYVTIFFYFS